MKNEKISPETHQQLIERAREMRANPTTAEAILWEQLRRKQVGGLRFRRQHLIHAYIVDFYCPEARLIVEVDGAIHKNTKDYDRERDQTLSAMGYKIVRFTNYEIENNIQRVISIIRRITNYRQ